MNRSHLYVPGDRADVLAKAVDRGADALIVDLEDAVAPAAKDTARATVAEFLAARIGPEGPQLWVRVNPGADALTDLRAVLGPAVSGICLAKAQTADEVAAVAAALDELEPGRGIEPGSVAISPLLESAAAVLNAEHLARAPRVVRLQLGEADLAADVGAEPGPDEREFLWARSHVVFASAAAGIEPPVAPVSTNFADPDALRESTIALRRMGFRGRACIHPAQLAVVNDVFTPSAEQVERARALLARYDAAISAGAGVFTDENGRMVDLAVVRAARRVLAQAG